MSYPSQQSEPFLIHLTRPHKHSPAAKENMLSIIESKMLLPGVRFLLDLDDASLSDAKFAVDWRKLTREEKKRFFGFISFTETPLREIYRLCNIPDRKKKLSGYGLVFLKDWLVRLGASPVIYINNVRGNRNEALQSLANYLIRENPSGAEQILPLVAVFGRFLKPVGGRKKEGSLDFTWEREWRLPYSESSILLLEEDKIFVGLCPGKEIEEFKKLLPSVPFIDPKSPGDYEAAIKRRCQELNPKLSPDSKLSPRSILGK
jgi:hypothetical protein